MLYYTLLYFTILYNTVLCRRCANSRTVVYYNTIYTIVQYALLSFYIILFIIFYFVGAVRTAGRAYARSAGPASCGSQPAAAAACQLDAAAQRGPHHTAASRSKTPSYSCLILVPPPTSTAPLMICYRAATSTALGVRMKHLGVISRCCPRWKILEQ